jgi:hypothetical protein
MDPDVSEAVERLRQTPDVKQIAVMPDVHLAELASENLSDPVLESVFQSEGALVVTNAYQSTQRDYWLFASSQP